MAVISQELVLKCQCKQRECVQGREAHLGSDVGFQQRLVENVRIRVAVACMDYNIRLLASDHRRRGWRHSVVAVNF